jgi:cell division GTPase FtsZ
MQLKNDISNADTILVNFTVHTDYSISIISEIMEILSDLCNEDASIILSTAPMKECDRSYVKLDIFLGISY